MNADGFAKAIRDVWHFLIPPLINLFFLGAVIETTFGRAAAPQISALKDKIDSTIHGYIDSSSEIVKGALSLFPNAEIEKFVTTGQNAIVTAISGINQYVTTFIVFSIIAVLSVAVLCNYITIFISSAIGFLFAMLSSFRQVGEVHERGLTYLVASPNPACRFVGRSIDYLSSETPPQDKYVLHAKEYFGVVGGPISMAELHKIVISWLKQNLKDGEWSSERAEAVSHLSVFQTMLQYIRVYLLIFIIYFTVNLFHIFAWPIRPLSFVSLALVWLSLRAAAARWKREVVARDLRAFFFYRMAAIASDTHSKSIVVEDMREEA